MCSIVPRGSHHSFFQVNFYLKIIVGSHVIAQNSAEKSHVPFPPSPPTVISCQTLVPPHYQDIDIDGDKILTVESPRVSFMNASPSPSPSHPWPLGKLPSVLHSSNFVVSSGPWSGRTTVTEGRIHHSFFLYTQIVFLIYMTCLTLWASELVTSGVEYHLRSWKLKIRVMTNFLSALSIPSVDSTGPQFWSWEGKVLQHRAGSLPLLLAGICSGNATREPI